MLNISKLESFYVGGTRTLTPSPFFGEDHVVTGAMYVQHIAPVERSFPLPVIFIHGGSHTGVTWETTPDGREGWQTLFVRGGFDTYVIDQAWRGRSAPDLSGALFGLEAPSPVGPVIIVGEKLAQQFDRAGGRFPMESLAQYTAQLWPDFGVPKALMAGHPGLSDPNALPPLIDLIDRLGQVVLMTHSQGGHLGWMAALARPDKVAAIYAVEPAQTSPKLDDPEFPDIPVCLLWGDNIPDEGMTLSAKDIAQGRAVAAIRPKVSVDVLPEQGITGNGHMLMMDDNSAELAARAMDWFRGLKL